MTQRLKRLQNIAETEKLDAFLLTSASTVTSLSGYFYNFEIGSSPFQLLPAALLVVPSRSTSIIIADNESFDVMDSDAEIVVIPYLSYVYKRPLDYNTQSLLKLHEELKEDNLTDARIGTEGNSLPFVISQSISSKYPNIELVDVTTDITNLRAILY